MIEPYKGKALTRLKKMKGQIEGVIKMIEEEKYCVDVITQMLAVQGSLKGIAPLILESHLNTCGMNHLATGDPKKKEKFIKELIQAFHLANR